MDLQGNYCHNITTKKNLSDGDDWLETLTCEKLESTYYRPQDELALFSANDSCFIILVSIMAISCVKIHWSVNCQVNRRDAQPRFDCLETFPRN